MHTKTQGKTHHSQQSHARRATLKIDGKVVAIQLTGPFQKASGSGLDGVTQVHSLGHAQSAERPGREQVIDTHGNASDTTADEVFALAVKLGRAKGFLVTATKL